jgi:Na+/melibiose symporter-like transporter
VATPKFSQKIALGSGFFCLLFLDKACESLAIPFYQMTLGVDPFLFSIALTIPIILSAFLGPWVGHLSDNFYSRFGRRRPFLLISSWLSGILFGLMWMVPEQWSTDLQLLYFYIISLLFYLSSTFYSVPLTSLSYEITLDVNKRIKVMEINTYFIKLASLAIQWLFPFASLAVFSSIFVGIKVVGWLVAIVVFGVIGMLPVLFVKERVADNDKPSIKKTSFVDNIKTISKVPLMKLVFVIVFMQVGLVAYAAKMDFYVLVYYMFDGDIAEGAIWKGVLSVGYALIAAIYIPIVSWLSRKLGKLSALKIIFLMTMFGGMGKWFIYTPGVQWLLLLDPIFCAAIWSSMTIIIPALVADASDQFREEHKINRGGGFAAMYHWIIALSVMFAILVSGATLKMIGFDAELGSNQPSDSLQMMKIILSLGTIIPSLIAVYILSRYQKSVRFLNAVS